MFYNCTKITPDINKEHKTLKFNGTLEDNEQITWLNLTIIYKH